MVFYSVYTDVQLVCKLCTIYIKQRPRFIDMYNRVGRGSLMLKHPNLHKILLALRGEWRNLTSRFTSTPERTNENIK